MSAAAFKSWTNIARAALNPIKAKVMLGKVAKRLSDPKGTLNDGAYKDWLKANAIPVEAFIEENFGHLKDETQEFDRALTVHANDVLARIPHSLGGGGGVPLLYAMVREMKPDVVVETGVAAGYSSASILSAMDKNGKGHLYSSDFPYFRIENPEQYVGVVVEERLKKRWSLFLKGDEHNIPDILAQIKGDIDLFHYDSDKSYTGRTKTLNAIFPRMSPQGTIIVDDIQDNCHFHDWVKARPFISWKVISYLGKYIGLIRK